MRTGGPNAGQGGFGWGSQVVENLVELVDIVATLEEGLAAQQLGEDAANRPDVDCVVLVRVLAAC